MTRRVARFTITGMETATYAAHIITADAQAMGDLEVIVMTAADETGASDVIASYPLAHDGNPNQLLTDNGWRPVAGCTDVEHGYYIVDVVAIDWEQITRHVTEERAKADVELARQDTAWRTIIRDAMHAGASATKLAKAAGDISRERVYQLRDGRR